MRAWRLTREAYAKQPLSGEGARRYGGRWSHVGTPLVYTSASLSLAVLEYLVNLSVADLPDDLISIEITIPDDLPRTEIPVRTLTDAWRSYPALEELKDMGTAWAQEGKTPILSVPSVVIPNEINYLINPASDKTKRVKVISVESFTLDVRLYGTPRKNKRPM